MEQPKQANPANWFRGRIAVKMMSSILALVLLMCGLFLATEYVISNRLTEKLEDQFNLRLSTNIQAVGKYLNSIPEHAYEIDGIQHPAHGKIKEQLEQIKNDYSLENVYILRKQQEKEQIVILTGVEEDYGTDYGFSPEMRAAIETSKQTFSSIYKDEYGTHKSIFLPLKDDKGGTYGIAGIDIDASVVPQTKNFIFLASIGIMAVLMLVGSLIAYFISRSITKPLTRLMHATEKVAAGDLSEEVTLQRSDEIGKLGDSFGRMRRNLDALIRQISASTQVITTTSEQVYQAAGEMSASSQQVASSMNSMNEGVTEVVTSISDSTASVVEVNEDLAKVSIEVQTMQETAHTVGSQSAEGQQLVEKTLRQMNVIQKEMKESQEAAAQLGSRSMEIGEIIHIITDIAQQTNLLALNASIEAARVGEQGKGFAVVAGEVKKLAEQSSNAASSITELISGTQNDSQLVLKSIKQGSQAVEQGQVWIHDMYENFKVIFIGISMFSEQIDHLKRALEKADKSFETITGSMQKISGVTEEQSAGYQEVGAAVEEQSATMQEVTSAIRNLSEMATELQKTVQQFKIAE
ncbi:methyl-accepting chemotaxis protein [Gorillibacterium sp. CAU 1737]|uniref:methyl-accepting chemotaxis protein n=1 Tax=Gorillibacterium sp. CAU 1737 TaxID=3140362 RepID=UPI003260F527